MKWRSTTQSQQSYLDCLFELGVRIEMRPKNRIFCLLIISNPDFLAFQRAVRPGLDSSLLFE